MNGLPVLDDLYQQKDLKPDTAQLAVLARLQALAQRLAALRFLFVQVLKRRWSIEETPYPKRPSKLPGGPCTDLEPRCDRMSPYSSPASSSVGRPVPFAAVA